MMESTMTAEQARLLRSAYSQDAQQLNAMPRRQLAELELAELEATGFTRIMGGPQTKDELMNEIMNRRYPAILMRESIHILQHGPGKVSSSACHWCHPHDGRHCDCSTGPEVPAAMQAARLRLDAIISREMTNRERNGSD